ncbi:mechanosensitive ion channel domain-containing protein [Thiohalocapsa marina]|uniref:mechanosensitive ion channel domain-containing protein n=1 Tax=Thiohalocapsa marina TaxID=424902 RepID=UPI0036DD9181
MCWGGSTERTTRIRTFHDSQLSVPNSVTTNATIDNMGGGGALVGLRAGRRCVPSLRT